MVGMADVLTDFAMAALHFIMMDLVVFQALDLGILDLDIPASPILDAGIFADHSVVADAAGSYRNYSLT